MTDADVVLGLLRADTFLAGRMPLDDQAARAAVGRLADALGLSLEETAAGIVNVNNLRAATLIRQQTLERGLDPRDFVLYSYGGAGPVHAFGYAREIGVREVLIPLGNGASTLSAYGIASGDLARFVEVETALRAPIEEDALQRVVIDAASRARQSMLDAGVVAEPDVELWALMRYQEQLMHALEIPVDVDTKPGQLIERFVREYAQRYGGSAASAFQAAEVFALRARARVPGSTVEVMSSPEMSGGGVASKTVVVFWPHTGERLDTTVYDGADIRRGHTVNGPALVLLPHTTVAVPRGATLMADSGHFHLRLPHEEVAK